MSQEPFDLEKLSAQNCIAWILQNKVVNENGSPIEFENHSFMIEPYLDNSEKLVVEKCAQIGFSTWAILRSFHLARFAGANIIHTFPSRNMSKDFVIPKVNPLIARNKCLSDLVGVDRIEIKQVGDRYIYYRGCFSDDTEILTVNGWRKWSEVKEGELMPTINQKTEKIELKSIKKVFAYEIHENLVHIKNRSIDCLVTKDHNLLVRKRHNGKLQPVKARDVVGFSNWRIPLVGKGYSGKGFAESPDFFELLGWIISEGSYWIERYKCRKPKYKTDHIIEYLRVCIHQKVYTEHIRSLLNRLKVSFYMKEDYRFELGRVVSRKIRGILPIKHDFAHLLFRMNNKQLRALFRGLMMGDGNVVGNRFTQKNIYAVNGFQTLCVLLGKATSCYKRRGLDIYDVGVKKSRNCFKFEVDNPLYKGKVWCVENENHSLFARRNGKVFVSLNSYEQTEAISISAHILMNDEFDRSNQSVLKTYRSRLDDAKREMPDLGWEWQFSNPSVPGYGVDVMWNESDQKHWFVKCPHCNYDWYLKFPDNIDFDKKLRICTKCKRPLSNESLLAGRWVKKYKDRNISGYWISQMFIPWISAEKLIRDSLGDQAVFHNFTLGLPFISKDIGITRQNILNCLSPGFNPRNNVAIGVDNGVKKHYVVGNRYGIFEIGVTEDWQYIEDLRNRYNASMVIDAMPYPTTPNKLAEKYNGKIYVHYFRQDKKNLGLIRWEGGVVVSDRTKVIDFVVAEINAKDIVFNMTQAEMEEFITHCTNVFRMIKQSQTGIPKPSWETIEGRPDHFLFATIYWRIALEQTFGQGGIVSPVASAHRSLNYEANPDSTVPALNLKEVLERTNKPQKKGWGSI